MVNHILGTNIFENQELCAGDLDGSGDINITDIVQIVNQILGN